MKIAVIGRTKILLDAIKLLEKTDHEIVLIGTCRPESGYKSEEKFEMEAKMLKIPFFCSTKINSQEIIDLLSSVKADIAISINWITIINKKAMDCFRYGIINAHCGDLPRYRGNACPNWAIINQEPYIGISIHFMVPGELDSGDIIIKEKYQLTFTTTITDIYNYLEKEIPGMFLKAIEKIQRGHEDYVRQSKEPSDVYRCYPRIPSDSLIDWNHSCQDIYNLVRASCEPFEGAYTYWKGRKYYIMDCEIQPFQFPSAVIPGQVIWIDKEKDLVGIAAEDGAIVIKKLKLDGKIVEVTKEISSTRIRFNECLADKIYELENKLRNLEKKMDSLTLELNKTKREEEVELG